MQKIRKRTMVTILVLTLLAGCNDNEKDRSQNQQGNMGSGMETSDTGH